jgi:hypothetical protein
MNQLTFSFSSQGVIEYTRGWVNGGELYDAYP